MQLPEIPPQITLKTNLANFFRENLAKSENSVPIDVFKQLIEQELANQEDIQKLKILSRCWCYTPLSDPQFMEYMQTIELEIANKVIEKFLSLKEIPTATEFDQQICNFIQDIENSKIIWETIYSHQIINQIQKSTQENFANRN